MLQVGIILGWAGLMILYHNHVVYIIARLVWCSIVVGSQKPVSSDTVEGLATSCDSLCLLADYCDNHHGSAVTLGWPQIIGAGLEMNEALCW